MSVPQPRFSHVPPKGVRSRSRLQPKRSQRSSSRITQIRKLGWEMTGRLTVNVAMSLVALATLVRLIPYYQTQRQVLHDMETSVETATRETKRLRADFSRYFDPTQTSQIIQESGARQSEQHIPIVLVDPLSPPAESTPE